MVTLSRIYTRGGDEGRTSLGDGARVAKHSPRVEAYGTVDEANATIGLARLHTTGEADAMLARIQNDLFDLGADLCRPGADVEDGRLRVIDSGDFWLSTTPEKPGSVSWNMSLPRMVTWAEMEVIGTGVRFHYFNTHFAHRDVDGAARLKSAQLLRCRIELLEEDAPVLVTGDFNASAGGPVYQTLVPALADAWREAAERKGPEDTFHGFTGRPRPGRIDWILFRAPWKVRLAETISDRKGNVFPSDHFPVLVVFDLP